MSFLFQAFCLLSCTNLPKPLARMSYLWCLGLIPGVTLNTAAVGQCAYFLTASLECAILTYAFALSANQVMTRVNVFGLSECQALALN